MCIVLSAASGPTQDSKLYANGAEAARSCFQPSLYHPFRRVSTALGRRRNTTAGTQR